MIAITGGGTGGHLSVAKAICEELNKQNIKPIYIGSINGQDKAWFGNFDGFSEKFFLNTSGVVNKKGKDKILSLLKILFLSFKCLYYFKKYNIKKVFCVGGYSASSASIAAIISKKNLYIHEQNAVSGNLNSKLKKYAKAFFSCYHDISPIKFYPTDEKFFIEKNSTKIKTILFLGGSQGASFINNLAKELSTFLQEENIQVIHQCGKNEYENLKKYYQQKKIYNVILFAFSKNLNEYIKEVDFAISRAGASSLWELSASNTPALFIPYPYAYKNHQYENAKKLLEKRACFLITQDKITPKEVKKIIKNADLVHLRKNLSTLCDKNATKNIVEYILKD